MTVSKKEHIMEIAYNSFVDRGYENTNIRKICKAVNVEPPTIYYYFKSKKGLFFAVARSIYEKYNKLLVAQNLIERMISPDEKLMELFKFNLLYAKENPRDIKFKLRYDLFPPQDITEEWVAFENLNSFYFYDVMNKIFEECVQKDLIAMEHLDSIRKIYSMFILKFCYYTVLFGYCPEDDEIIKIWEFFIEDKLKMS